MTFIRLGHRYVNVEMITDVFVQDARPEEPKRHVEVYLAVPMGLRPVSDAPMDVTTRHIHVSGKEADQLIQFIEDHRVARD